MSQGEGGGQPREAITARGADRYVARDVGEQRESGKNKDQRSNSKGTIPTWKPRRGAEVSVKKKDKSPLGMGKSKDCPGRCSAKRRTAVDHGGGKKASW